MKRWDSLDVLVIVIFGSLFGGVFVIAVGTAVSIALGKC